VIAAAVVAALAGIGVYKGSLIVRRNRKEERQE
jgi:hypothetical protein